MYLDTVVYKLLKQNKKKKLFLTGSSGCYDMAFQQVIIISFNLILSGGTYLIWKISSYP